MNDLVQHSATLTLTHLIGGERVSGAALGESINPSNTDDIVARVPRGGDAEVDAFLDTYLLAYHALRGANPA